MRLALRLVFLIPALAVIIPLVGAQVVPNPDKDKLDETKLRLGMLTKFAKDGKFVAKLVDIDDDGGTVQVDYEYQKFSMIYSDLLAKYNEAKKARNTNEMKNVYNQLADVAKKNQVYDIEKIPLQFKLTFKAGAKIDDKKTADPKKKDADKKDAEKKDEKADKKDAEKGEKGESMLLIRRAQLPPKDPENPKVRYTLATSAIKPR
jgi:hypothetical protein